MKNEKKVLSIYDLWKVFLILGIFDYIIFIVILLMSEFGNYNFENIISYLSKIGISLLAISFILNITLIKVKSKPYVLPLNKTKNDFQNDFINNIENDGFIHELKKQNVIIYRKKDFLSKYTFLVNKFFRPTSYGVILIYDMKKSSMDDFYNEMQPLIKEYLDNYSSKDYLQLIIIVITNGHKILINSKELYQKFHFLSLKNYSHITMFAFDNINKEFLIFSPSLFKDFYNHFKDTFEYILSIININYDKRKLERFFKY